MEEILGSLFGAVGDFITGDMNRNTQENIAAQNFAQQQQALQSGLSIKASDARRAEKNYGINALTLLGASTFNPSPVSIGDTGGNLGSVGRGIGSALGALIDKPDEKATEAVDLKLENARLQNRLLEIRINDAVNPKAGLPPNQMVDLQSGVLGGTNWSGPNDAIKMEQKIVPSSTYNASIAKGMSPETELSIGRFGYIPQPAEKSLLAIDPIAMLQWNVRNRLYPTVETLFSEKPHPQAPNRDPGPGRYWRLGLDGEWYPAVKYKNSWIGRKLERWWQ